MAAKAGYQRLSHTLRQALAAQPILLAAARALGMAGFCFVLSGAGLLDGHVPLALAPVCVLPFGAQAVCAYLGAAAGYAVFWGFSAAVEPIAAGFLLLAGSCLLEGLLPQQRWAGAAVASAIYALLGIIFLLQADAGPVGALRLVLRLTLLNGSVRALRPAHTDAGLQPRAAVICLLAGLVRVTVLLDIPLAIVLASVLCLRHAAQPDALAIGAACGLVIDLGSTPAPPQTACLCLPLLVCRHLAARKSARAVSFLGSYFLCVLVWGGEHASWTLGVLGGCILSCFLSDEPMARARDTRSDASDRLQQAAEVLTRLGAVLELEQPQTQTAPALIFDSAANEVCRSCVRQEQCWQTHADETYRLLCACAGRLLRQGQVRPGDLPSGFCDMCIRAEAFRAALNHALHAQQAQLLALRRSEEAQQIARALFAHLGRFVCALAARRPVPDQPRFRAELGVRAVGLRADAICGDCGTSFVCGTVQYVLLCDGMGTGAAARGDAEEAISLLQTLITLGFAAPEAMALLNELYLLRADGCFSTVDLLELELCTGEGTLYKWGAAPSFLKKGASVKKIGAASPPPGLGVGEGHQAGCVRLSLQRGEQLVLVTDGIPEQLCVQYLRSCGTPAPCELAAGLVACTSESEPDDRTAAVVQLEPVFLRHHHTTRTARNASNVGTKPHI